LRPSSRIASSAQRYEASKASIRSPKRSSACAVEFHRQIEEIGVEQRVVAAERDDDVGDVASDARELRTEVRGGGAVDRTERHAPRRREESAEVGGDVGLTPGVHVIVEDRVSDEGEVG
jgi:hypothetical protein